MQNIEKIEPFTVKQVNARIPFLSRVVADLVGHWRQREHIRMQLGRFRRELPGSGSRELTETIQRLEEEDQRLTAALHDLEGEINQIGGIVKDPGRGLVDFISRHEISKHAGRLLYLSWMPGEPEVSYWHRIEDDASDRRPLESL